MKNTKYKVNSWVITAVVVIAVILLNVIVTVVNSKYPLKVDLTKEKVFEMTDETKKIMSELDKTVNGYVLCTKEQADVLVKEYVDRYKQMSKKINFEYIDIYKNQTMLTKYQQKGESIAQGDIVLECGDKYKIISVESLINNLSAVGGESLYSFDLESKMTNGIVTVTGLMEETTFYFLTGHGEQATKEFNNIIEGQDNKIETISILTQDIPKDATVLATVLPTADYSAEECEKIDKFLDQGGKLLVLYSPGLESCPRFESYLSEWGITPQHTLVVENDSQKVSQSPVMFFPEMQEHEITKNIISMKLPVLFYGSVNFSLSNSNTQKATVTSLAKTSSKAIGKINMQSNTPSYEEGDLKGPLDVAVISEKSVKDKDGKDVKGSIIAIGSANAVELTQQSTGNSANEDFTSNVISYLTSSSNNLKISSKILTQGLFTQPNAQVSTILYYLLVWVLPLGLLCVGIVIWLKRRYL